MFFISCDSFVFCAKSQTQGMYFHKFMSTKCLGAHEGQRSVLNFLKLELTGGYETPVDVGN